MNKIPLVCIASNSNFAEYSRLNQWLMTLFTKLELQFCIRMKLKASIFNMNSNFCQHTSKKWCRWFCSFIFGSFNRFFSFSISFFLASWPFLFKNEMKLRAEFVCMQSIVQHIFVAIFLFLHSNFFFIEENFYYENTQRGAVRETKWGRCILSELFSTMRHVWIDFKLWTRWKTRIGEIFIFAQIIFNNAFTFLSLLFDDIIYDGCNIWDYAFSKL